jgi:prepilin-type N-terminal cleavage/methylation domain-containing protein
MGPAGVDLTVSSGFTLIEVIVTLTILGFIVLMISGTFRLGLSSWEKGDSIKEDYQKIRMISQLVSRQMKSLVPYKIKTEKAWPLRQNDRRGLFMWFISSKTRGIKRGVWSFMNKGL